MGSTESSSRRAFLRNSGAALLGGYAFTNRTGLAQNVARPDASKYQSINVKTHDYHGDITERLDFPKDWKVTMPVMVGDKNPSLTREQIIQKIRTPIGSKSLADLAKGKKNAVVTFDDTSRPNTCKIVAELVVNELNAAGIDDNHILFLAATGSHQHMTTQEVKEKLGPVFLRCPWVNHSQFFNLIDVGRTSYNNNIQTNAYFMKADLRVLIGNIREHAGCGFGGGAKSIIPGVVSLQTIFYNHAIVGGLEMPRNGGYEGDARGQSGRLRVIDNIRRLDALEAARLSNVDFSINIVPNGKVEVQNIFCGDIFEAHIEACRYANDNICWDMNAKAGEHDIIINNSWPASRNRPVAFGTPKEGGTSISISQSPQGTQFHQLSESSNFNPGENWWGRNFRPGAAKYDRIIFSQYLGKSSTINTGAAIVPTWDKILATLEQKYKGSSSVSVFLYPYGPIAHEKKVCTLYPEDVKKI